MPMLAQSFLAIPAVVAATDLIATVPALALEGAPLHPGVRVLQPPLDFPPLHSALYWHERTNADPRHRWFRRLAANVVHGLERSAWNIAHLPKFNPLSQSASGLRCRPE